MQIKLFFSATYCGEGNNEIIVGEALKDLPRDSFVVATAAPCNEHDNRTGLLSDKFNARAYLEKEGSLRRFGLEQIDIILFPLLPKRRLCATRRFSGQWNSSKSRVKSDLPGTLHTAALRKHHRSCLNRHL